MLSTGGYKLEFLSEKVESLSALPRSEDITARLVELAREIQALGDRFHDKSVKVFSLKWLEALKTVNRAALFEIAEEVNSSKERRRAVNAVGGRGMETRHLAILGIDSRPRRTALPGLWWRDPFQP